MTYIGLQFAPSLKYRHQAAVDNPHCWWNVIRVYDVPPFLVREHDLLNTMRRTGEAGRTFLTNISSTRVPTTPDERIVNIWGTQSTARLATRGGRTNLRLQYLWLIRVRISTRFPQLCRDTFRALEGIYKIALVTFNVSSEGPRTATDAERGPGSGCSLRHTWRGTLCGCQHLSGLISLKECSVPFSPYYLVVDDNIVERQETCVLDVVVLFILQHVGST